MKILGLRLGGYPRAFAWSPDGAALTVGLDSGELCGFDGTGRPLRNVRGHSEGILALDWNPPGTTLASAGEDGRVRLWNRDGRQAVADLEGGAPWVTQVAWAPTGRFLASAAGRSVRFWNPVDASLVGTRTLGATIEAIAWRPAGAQLAVAGYGMVVLVDPVEEEATATLPWRSAFVALAWSADGNHLAAGTLERSVLYWRRPGDEAEPLEMTGYPSKVRQLAWDSSSRYLACGGSTEVTVWDVSGAGPAGTTPRELAGHEGEISALQWQPHGTLLASGDRRGSVWLWNPSSPGRGLRAATLPAPICGLAWAPEGKRLALLAEDGTLAMAGV